MATSKRERQKAARREKLERQERYNKRRKTIRRSIIVVIIAVLVVGTGAFLFSSGKKTPTTTTTIASSAGTTTTTPTTTTTQPAKYAITQAQSNAKAVAYGCPTSTATRVNTMIWKTAPPLTINKADKYYATFDTTAGTFVVELDAKTAPITTNNFVFLAEHNFYKCVIFHRVISTFMIQSGDPTGTGTGGPGYTIPDEYPKTGSPTYPLYSIAMANTGAPHTGGSQFFIVTGSEGETLPNSYSLFGKVISGFEAVNTIQDAGSTSSSGVPPAITFRILNIKINAL
jgi:cyclophilin family peptidyl-prolyl cis-trans isomerase/flagellar basal body-associated protein FliL